MAQYPAGLIVGNSRLSCVSMPLPFSQRKLVNQLLWLEASARRKIKFGRRLSQSTLRRLLTVALKSGYPHKGPDRKQRSSRFRQPSSIDTSPLWRSSGNDQVMIRAGILRGQIKLAVQYFILIAFGRFLI